MRNPTATTTLLTLFLAALCCDAADGQRRRSGGWRERAAGDQPPLENLVRKADQALPSKAVRDAKFTIYLPKDYDAAANAGRRYPVIYFLHGMFEDHNRFGTRGGARVLDQAIADKLLPEVLFVCAYDGTRRSFYVDQDGGKVETMIVEELVPFIDKHYRTKAERGQRVLMGVSMGGFGAMKIAFKHPKSFGILATHSAAILPEDPKQLDTMFPWAHQSRLAASIFGNPLDEQRWRAENPLILASNLDATTLSGIRIYFDCGDQDRYGLDATNQQMHRLLEKRRVPHTFRLVKGGNHGWNTRSSEIGYNVANLPNSLRFVGAALARGAATRRLQGLLDGGLGGDRKK